MAIPRIVAILTWALIICQAYGQLASWYNCPTSCTGQCRCASAKSPVPNPPQFILLTHDDAITSFSFSTVLNALKGLKNPNGCDLPATFYVSIQESLDYLIHHLYMSNHEIADHTFNHPHLPNEAEIKSAIDWIHTNADVPIEEIRGFRAPFLEHDVAQRQTLYRLGLKYDASITEQPSDNQLFPYSLDHGVAIDCTKGTGTCDPKESYPGMWSVPLWTLPRASTSMDIVGDVYTQYSKEFKKKFYGNRAPLGIFCHSGWLNTNIDAVKRFLKESLEKSDDVWVVTNWQLIQWMKNPVSAAEYRRQMTKGKFCPRSPKGPTPPMGDCVFGSWDKSLYRCSCQAENNPNANGYCRGSDGACTVPKLFTNGVWHCPGQQPNSRLWQQQNLANNVKASIQQPVLDTAMRSIRDGARQILHQGYALNVEESPFYVWPECDHKYDPQTGKHYFYGVEIPNLVD